MSVPFSWSGWNGESGSTVNNAYPSEDAEAANAPTANDGWLEYKNVDLAYGATSLNLNLVYYKSSDDVTVPDVTINVYYGATAPTEGETPNGTITLSQSDDDYTTTDDGFENTPASDYGVKTVSVDIPSGITNIYIQFVSASGSPQSYIALATWQFSHS